MKKVLALILTLVMAVSMFAACGEKAPAEAETTAKVETQAAGSKETAAENTSGEQKKVTALFFSLEADGFKLFDSLLNQYFTEMGYAYESQSSNMDGITMIEQIENAVAGGTDALWVWAINAQEVKDALVAAKSQGVIVYNFVTDPGPDARDVFRGSDNEACGRAIGEMAIEWADETYGKDAEDGAIKSILIGDPSSDQNKITFEALQATIAADPRFEILEAVGISTSIVDAQATAENMYSKYGTEIDAFITTSDAFSCGVAAYLQSEMSAVEDPTLIGLFGTEVNNETAQLLKDNILKGTVSNGGLITDNTRVMAEQLDALLKGETPEGVDETGFSGVDMGKVKVEDLAGYGF